MTKAVKIEAVPGTHGDRVRVGNLEVGFTELRRFVQQQLDIRDALGASAVAHQVQACYEAMQEGVITRTPQSPAA